MLSTYGWILLGTVFFPLALSFDRRVAFFRQWHLALLAALAVAPLFVAWDAWASARGDWSFAESQVAGLRLWGLPLEELLFFLLVPFACVFIWLCLRAYLPVRRFRVRSWPFLVLGALCAVLAVAAWPRFYTATILGFAALFLFALAGPWRVAAASSHFWLAQAICFLPFLAVNGLLTGIPVVSYADQAILGWRIFTIPVEDALYSFVLVGANILVFASLERRLAPAEGRGRRALVVGAGLGGLAVAARLARRGWQVTVFESAPGSGGKAGNEEQGGFRFDTGPSLLTMPAVFDELFRFCGEQREEHLAFVELPEICAYWWPDGSRFQSCRSAAGLADRLGQAFGEDPRRVAAYLRSARRIHDISAGLFLEHSLHEPASYLSPAGLRGILGLPWMKLRGTLHGLHARFFKDPRSVQLFDRLATYNGSSPYRTPATMSIIAHSEYGLGGYAVRCGIRAIPAAIEALGRRLGVEYRFGHRVERIVVEKGRARALMVGGIRHDADIVISNADVERSYRELLGRPEDRLCRRQRSMEASSSGLVFYWGVARRFPELQVNNIFFSADYAADFKAIFEDLRCPDDPTVYVNITSKVDPGDAPAGSENWFVLVNAPRDAGQDWRAEAQRVRRAVIARISAALDCELESLIVSESVMAPPDIARASGSPQGSLYGIASNQPRAAFLRHPNRHPRIGGLYFCGGSAHPGGGMPLVLQSARIAAELVSRYEGYRS